MLFEHERISGRASALGPVPLVRHMVALSMFLLVVFMATALSPDVSTASGDIFASSGLKLAVNELFLLSAAGIGATFAALFKANRYIANGTYESKYESSYWVRFVLGLLAGIVLASLIPIKSSGSGAGLSRPFLALLGGFSASVVFKILTQVVGTLESLVQGDSSDAEAAKIRSSQAEMAAQRTQDQMRLGAGLVKLREQLGAGLSTDQLAANLNKMLNELLPVDSDGYEASESGSTVPLVTEAKTIAPGNGNEDAATIASETPDTPVAAGG